MPFKGLHVLVGVLFRNVWLSYSGGAQGPLPECDAEQDGLHHPNVIVTNIADGYTGVAALVTPHRNVGDQKLWEGLQDGIQILQPLLIGAA